jgi:uncharacterized protein (DUF4415 family)
MAEIKRGRGRPRVDKPSSCVYGVCLKVEVLEDVRQLAKREKSSINRVLRSAVEQYLQNNS